MVFRKKIYGKGFCKRSAIGYRFILLHGKFAVYLWLYIVYKRFTWASELRRRENDWCHFLLSTLGHRWFMTKKPDFSKSKWLMRPSPVKTITKWAIHKFQKSLVQREKTWLHLSQTSWGIPNSNFVYELYIIHIIHSRHVYTISFFVSFFMNFLSFYYFQRTHFAFWKGPICYPDI